MINKDINKIIIVGGGSAGWMSASTFSAFFPEKEIVVIESPDFPRMGVGESTLEQVRYWMHAVGIDIADFTNANLSGSDFTETYITRSNFNNADITETDFSKANY